MALTFQKLAVLEVTLKRAVVALEKIAEETAELRRLTELDLLEKYHGAARADGSFRREDLRRGPGGLKWVPR